MSTTVSNISLLLPSTALPQTKVASHFEWTPTGYLSEPQPPPLDDNKMLEHELASSKLMIDGKMIKKTRPRRTVDYNGGMGRWALLRKLRPNPIYTPQIRPSPPYIIDLLPPKAYPQNSSTSLCTKFVHTSTNKIRCPVNVVTWTPEGRRILTGSSSGEFTLWNGLTFNFETILQAHDTAICTFSFTHSGAYLVSGDKSGIIKYFEPNMNYLTSSRVPNSSEAVRGLSFSPDDSRFVSACDDSIVRIWDFKTGQVESDLTGHGWDVKCVQWHPTKGLIVSGSKDSQIKFWDPRTGTVLSTLNHHKKPLHALAWSPDGNMVASASRDPTVRIFDIRAMKEFRVLKGHKKEVCSLTWHPFHPLLVSGGAEGSVLHWDLAVSETELGQDVSLPRATLSQAHDSQVWSMAFHPLGHLLVTASNDNTTRFWSRERPGDPTSVFSGGGEKPPEMMDNGGQDDEQDDVMVPGFGGGNGWFKEEDSQAQEFSNDYPQMGARSGAGDDYIPGFGMGGGGTEEEADNYGRDTGRYPSQQQDYGNGNGNGNGWGRGGGDDQWRRTNDNRTGEGRYNNNNNNNNNNGNNTRWGQRRPRY